MPFSLLEPLPPSAVVVSLLDYHERVRQGIVDAFALPRYLLDGNIEPGTAYLIKQRRMPLFNYRMPEFKFSDRWVRKRPRSPDMAQMLDDLGIEHGYA